MPRRGRRRGAFWAALAAAAIGCTEALAAAPCEPAAIDCFSMAKRTVILTAARRYETATFYESARHTGKGRPVARDADAAELAALAAIPGVTRVLAEPLLQRFGIVMLELAGDADRSTVRTLVQAMGASSGDDRGGSPVYSGGAGHQILVNEVLVKFAGRDREQHRDVLRRVGASVVTGIQLGHDEVYVISFPGQGGGYARLASNALDGRSDVVYAQPNFISFADRADASRPAGLTHESMCAVDACPPGGSPEGRQPEPLAAGWYLHEYSTDGAPAGINARAAWGITRGNPEIVVAILDDGVDIDHPMLSGRIHSTWNAHTESPDLALQDFDRHGTAMAGLVAAVAPEVRMMPVRVFAWSASGLSYFPRHVIARGIRYAADSAHVLAMGWSLGRLPDGEPIIDDALDFAVRNGRVIVSAAGNAGGPVAYPARLSAIAPIIAVGAIDERHELKARRGGPCDWGSNFGPEIDVTAPGVNLLTLDRPGAGGYCASGDYTSSFGGTSGAAALVAGAAALVLSREPHLSPQDVRERLRSTAVDLGEPGVDPRFGHGRIDVCHALLGAYCERRARPDREPDWEQPD